MLRGHTDMILIPLAIDVDSCGRPVSQFYDWLLSASLTLYTILLDAIAFYLFLVISHTYI